MFFELLLYLLAVAILIMIFLLELCKCFLLTLQVSRRRHEMYSIRLYVCLSVSVHGRMPTLLHRPGCNLGEWYGCPLVVHYWADLQSVHGLDCYDNTARMWNVSECLYSLVCLVYFICWTFYCCCHHSWNYNQLLNVFDKCEHILFYSGQWKCRLGNLCLSDSQMCNPKSMYENVYFCVLFSHMMPVWSSLQCFDTVGWVTAYKTNSCSIYAQSFSFGTHGPVCVGIQGPRKKYGNLCFSKSKSCFLKSKNFVFRYLKILSKDLFLLIFRRTWHNFRHSTVVKSPWVAVANMADRMILHIFCEEDTWKRP